MDLPKDIQIFIISFNINIKNWREYAVVCKKWYNYVKSDTIMKIIQQIYGTAFEHNIYAGVRKHYTDINNIHQYVVYIDNGPFLQRRVKTIYGSFYLQNQIYNVLGKNSIGKVKDNKLKMYTDEHHNYEKYKYTTIKKISYYGKISVFLAGIIYVVVKILK